jgi:hypothetical protein
MVDTDITTTKGYDPHYEYGRMKKEIMESESFWGHTLQLKAEYIQQAHKS